MKSIDAFMVLIGKYFKSNRMQVKDRKQYLSEGVCYIMVISLNFAAVAVTALKGLHHSGDGEGQQKKPDEDRDLRRFLQNFDKVPPSKMDHVEVAINGQGDKEGNAGSSIEKQHEEHRLTHHIIRAVPLVVTVVVGLGRKTGHQQEISNHNIEQEDGFILPELEPIEEVVNKTGVVLFAQHQE